MRMDLQQKIVDLQEVILCRSSASMMSTGFRRFKQLNRALVFNSNHLLHTRHTHLEKRDA